MLKGITTNDLKPGMTIMFRGKLHVVLVYEHIKPGKGHAFVRCKLRNVGSEAQFEHTFNSKEKIDQAIIDNREVEYLYRDGNKLNFMDQSTYETVSYDISLLGDRLAFLKENTMCEVMEYDNAPIQISIPDHINFKVIEAEPAVRGDTATNVTKNVTIETGANIRVPMFINKDDIIRIDTRTGEYIERVKKE